MTAATRGQTRQTAMAARNGRMGALVREIPALFDSSELASLLGTTERHIERLVAERRIPFVKVGRFVRFDAEAVVRWLGEMTVEPRR
jgi:excisionase family DNA binding protein